MIDSAEAAYERIGKILVSKSSQGWTSLRAICPILNQGCGGITTTQEGKEGEADLPIGWEIFDLQEACLFLRNDLLEKTAQRIWGLTFTLYPDGRFNIEYDYNKPEGHEESDETVEVSLTDFAGKINKK